MPGGDFSDKEIGICMDVAGGATEVKESAVVGVVPVRGRFTSDKLWISTIYSTVMSSGTLVMTDTTLQS